MRGIISALTSAAALMGVAGTLAAQQPVPRKEAPSVKSDRPEGTMCYSTDDSKTECRSLRRSSIDSVMMKRAALGLQLSATGTKRDTLGVFVAAVTPKGPAENAGIVEGDRIVSINGVDLRVSGADAGDEYASGLPSRRLVREVEKLSPGNIVNLRVWSGGRVRDVQVTAGRASDLRGNGFGMMLDGGPGGFTLRSLPRMNMEDFTGPMMRMEDMPRMRQEDMRKMEDMMPRLRERLQDLPMRLKELDMAPMRMRLNEGGTWKMMEPSRVRVMGPEGRFYIYRDSTGTLKKARTYTEKSKADKAAVEKEKKESEKKK
jgi:Trypsin-like serine proteases, typically periplasmic, contain C-terminal PDZ domain